MKATCRLVVAAFLAAALSSAATLSRRPYLQNVRRDRAIVMWATFDGGRGVVQSSSDKSYSRSVSAQSRLFLPAETGLSAPFTQFQAELTGLNPNTDYFYRVMVDGQNMTPADELHFRTGGGQDRLHFWPLATAVLPPLHNSRWPHA